jgi:cyclohexanone monooxygenase
VSNNHSLILRGDVGPYRQICNDVAAKDYEGFVMTGAEQKKRAAS